MYAPSGPAMSSAPPLAPTSGNDQLSMALLQLLPFLGVNAGQAMGAMPPNGGQPDITALLLEKMRQAQMGDPAMAGAGMMTMPGMPSGGMMGMPSGLGGGMMPGGGSY